MFKKLSPWYLLALVVLSLAVIYGCGTNPTGGGGGGGGTSHGTSSIEGNANLLKTKELTITPLAGVVVKVNPQTTTDASGDYTLTGLPSGEVQITATKETGCICGVSIITDSRDTVNFDFYELGDAVSGTARITGEITGILTDIQQWMGDYYFGLDIKAASGKTLSADYHVYYDNGSHTATYEVNNLPEGDTYYIIAKYIFGSSPPNGYPRFAYNKIAVPSTGTFNLNFAFNNQTLEATDIAYPSGYQILDFDISLVNSSDHRTVADILYFDGGSPPHPSATSNHSYKCFRNAAAAGRGFI